MPKVTLVNVPVAPPPCFEFESESSLGLVADEDQGAGWEARQVTHKRPHYKASQLAKKKKKVVGRKKGVPTTTATAETASGAGSGAPSLVAQGGEPKLGGTTANDAAYLKDILKERMRGGSSGDAPNPPQELRSKFRLFTKSTL